MRPFSYSEPGALLGLLAAGLALNALPGPTAGANAPAPELSRPSAESHRPRAVWAEALHGLQLEFVDPVSSRTYRARGPYELLSQSASRVEVRAAGRAGERAPTVTLVQTLDALWAFARFDEHEFVVRLR